MNLEICDKPVFVVGPPRSGTSMMQWSLRQHPAMWGGEESDFLVPLIRNLQRTYEAGCKRESKHWLSAQGVTYDEFLQHVGYGLNALYMSRSKGRRWVEQTPQYTLLIDDVARMFPGAVFLLMIRDGRQVVASLRNFVNPMPHPRACRTWLEFTRTGLDLAASERGARLYPVRYERLVTDPEQELRRLYEWLELEFEQRSVHFIAKRAPINSSFPNESSKDKLKPKWLDWTRSERRTFVDIAGDLLVELGYERDHSWAERLEVVGGGSATDDAGGKASPGK